MKRSRILALVLVAMISTCILARVETPERAPGVFRDIWAALLDLQDQIDHIELIPDPSFWQLVDPDDPENYDIHYDDGDVTIGNDLKVNGQIEITGGSPGLGKVLTSDAFGLAIWESIPGTTTLWKLVAPEDQENLDIRYNNGDVIIGNDLEVNGQIEITGGSPGLGKVLTSDAYGLASWKFMPSGGALNLPYAGTVGLDDIDAAFSITNEGDGDGIRGITDDWLSCGVYGENSGTGTTGYLGGYSRAAYGLGEHGHEGALGASSAGVWAKYTGSDYYVMLGLADHAAKFNGPIQNLNIARHSSGSLMTYNSETHEIGISSSSARFKKDIKPLEDDFNKLLQAGPKSFICRRSEQGDIGFIAEEFDALGLKNLVHYQDGKPFSIKYEKVPLYLLEVTKDQANAIEDLRAENDALKQRLEAIERAIGQPGQSM